MIDNIIEYLETSKRNGITKLYVSDEATRYLDELLAEDIVNVPCNITQKVLESKPLNISSFSPNKSNAPYDNNAESLPSASMEQIASMHWEELRATVSSCTKCELCNLGRKQTVFGAGNKNAHIMFISDGPNKYEDDRGVPFAGPAGKLLGKMIQAMQISKDDIYLANIVKCHPPYNRTPEDSEVNICINYLLRQIKLIKPKIIILLGAIPLKYLIKPNPYTSIHKLHGTWYKFDGIDCLPTFHPAYLLRSQDTKADAWDDLQKVMKKLKTYP